jgi:cell division protein ZapD
LVLYEYPFHEGIRTMLRLEHLFDRLGQLVARDAAVDHHFALATIFEVMDVASRADLKSDLLKDLERHRAQYQAFRGHPHISEAALDETTARIDHAHAGLNALQGKAGQALASNDWLMSIRSRISIPGGTCEFDLPAYYAWQQHPPARRRNDLLKRCTCCWACCAKAARCNAWPPPPASTSRACRRARLTTCCACVSTTKKAWFRRSPATG